MASMLVPTLVGILLPKPRVKLVKPLRLRIRFGPVAVTLAPSDVVKARPIL